MSKILNKKTSRNDVFGVRRTTVENDKTATWYIIEPDLDNTYAEIATTVAMIQGTTNHKFLFEGELIPKHFVGVGINVAVKNGWLRELEEGDYSPYNPPNYLIEIVNLAEESDSSIHEVAGEICYEQIESVMNENVMKTFVKHNQLIGLGGPCTAKTWPVVERLLWSNPSINHGFIQGSKLQNSNNFYREINEGKEVEVNDCY